MSKATSLLWTEVVVQICNIIRRVLFFLNGKINYNKIYDNFEKMNKIDDQT
jgi:hypothetical protein